MKNPNLRFHYFYSSFQSLPAKVEVNRVRGKKKKNFKMYFEERERKEKEIKVKEREIHKKFQVLR